MPMVRGTSYFRVAIVSAAIVSVALAVLSTPARACSFAGPVDFVGRAVLVDIDTGESRTASFSDVGIGATCEVTNRMDVDGETAMVQLGHGIRLFSLASDGVQVDLPTPRAGFPDLDGGYVYYVDTSDTSLHRMHLGTRVDELLLNRPNVVGNASWPSGLFVQRGIGAWLRWESGAPFLSVYAVANRTFLFRGEPPLSLPASVPLELVGVHGARVTFAAEDELIRFDVPTNLTSRVGRIPSQAAYFHLVAQDGDRIAYVDNETLRILDLATNATEDTGRRVPGMNLALSGSLLSYDYYETVPYFIILPVIVVVALIAVIVFAIAAVHLARRRKGPR